MGGKGRTVFRFALGERGLSTGSLDLAFLGPISLLLQPECLVESGLEVSPEEGEVDIVIVRKEVVLTVVVNLLLFS